jgi:hypothetical protein
MLQRFYHTSWCTWSTREMQSISRLSALRGRPVREDIGCAMGLGLEDTAVLLEQLEITMRMLGLEAAPRSYRAGFTANYHALFPDADRHYRADVLEASMEQQSAIWVNGENFELSGEAVLHAARLQQTWLDLGTLLERWSSAPQSSKPRRSEVVATLNALDLAWSAFEHKYITDLINIERRARGLLVRAIDMENVLHLCEREQWSGSGVGEYEEARSNLVACIGQLNSVANVRGKGRSDLNARILDGAIEVLRKDAVGTMPNKYTTARAAAHIIGGDVVASFEAVRSYLQEVAGCLERVDPHLSNNVGLVARLEDWEESWEVGRRYLLDSRLLDAVCDLVAEIRRACQLAPALTTMCEDCDAELFLILPRMVVLCFAANPERMGTELLRSLLSHRFVFDQKGAAVRKPCTELANLSVQFVRLASLMGNCKRVDAELYSPPSARASEEAWRVVLERSVNGAALGPCGIKEAAHTALEDLMRDAECWSLELQRHCASDWNQCSAMLLHCLTEVAKKERVAGFQV